MIATILDEVINGWVLTIFKSGEKHQFIYEKYTDAKEHRNSEETKYIFHKVSVGMKEGNI